ncbi:SLBB domain-containing protein [Flavobacterium sp.]|uniref:polysaccharide biosynthesis/export family protein n=1 Tax=Flavobacterium sp. TaxID=239 RepID=UPI003BBE1D57
MIRNKTNCIKQVLLLFFFALTVLTAEAQLPGGVNIDQLSDAQLMQYAQQAGLTGLSEAELTMKAKEKGLSDDQILKLKARMQTFNPGGGAGGQGEKPTGDLKRQGIKYLLPKPSADSINGLVIYGSDIFTKENLTFEPNINIATPKNYVIGASDELKVDIYGFSDKSQTLKVSSDGNIRYPNIGPIKVSGLSIDEVKAKLTSALAKIYPGLKSGNTSLQITLGQIRSIRVNLIGEITKPGSYEVSSLSTIANVLYAAGGPTKIGSYRKIELIRSGKSIAKFDLYDYLLKGDLTQNKVLQDDDVIKVATYTARVEVRGAVKRNAIYEVDNADKLTDLLNYAGGLSDNANKDFIRIARFGKQEKEIFTIKAEEAKTFALQTGDKVLVDSLSFIFKNRVVINGSLYYQGDYSIEKTPTLKDLLLLAKPKEYAYTDRAMIRRFQADYTPEIIGFSVQEVVEGKFNINLIREDSIYIYSKTETNETFQIQILGEVNRPGAFPYLKGVKVQDIILMAGGFRDGASRKFVEVSRRIRDTLSGNASPQYAVILNINIDKSSNTELINTVLEPFDIVSVRKAPGYKEQVNVTIDGEVIYPGNYSIVSNQERLSDLLTRAGGIKEGAYPEGAFMLRRVFENISNNDSVILKNKIATLRASINDTIKAKAADSSFKGDLKIVGIRLDDVLNKKSSIYDVILQDGDIVKIPKRVETVQTFSGVYFPKKVVYRDGLSVKDVISECGGVVPGGEKKKAYVVYPNGEVKTTSSFLFFRNYPRVKPGSEVYVPVRKENKKLSTAEVLGITTGLATLATMVITIANLTK